MLTRRLCAAAHRHVMQNIRGLPMTHAKTLWLGPQIDIASRMLLATTAHALPRLPAFAAQNICHLRASSFSPLFAR